MHSHQTIVLFFSHLNGSWNVQWNPSRARCMEKIMSTIPVYGIQASSNQLTKQSQGDCRDNHMKWNRIFHFIVGLLNLTQKNPSSNILNENNRLPKLDYCTQLLKLFAWCSIKFYDGRNVPCFREMNGKIASSSHGMQIQVCISFYVALGKYGEKEKKKHTQTIKFWELECLRTTEFILIAGEKW